MDHTQSGDDELAITISKLEEATRQLVEKDLKIEALKNELARLHQGCSPWDVTEAHSSASDTFDAGKDNTRDGLTGEAALPSTPLFGLPTEPSTVVSDDVLAEEEPTIEALDFEDTQQTAQLDLNDGHWPEDQNELHGDPSADSHVESAPEVSQDASSQSTSWDASGNWNTHSSSWDPPSSWDTGKPWSPAPTDATPKENWRESLPRPESKSWLHPLSFANPAHTLSDVEYKDILDLHLLPITTRLEDDGWLDSPLEHVRVDDERLFRLLTKGREVAQRCLWAFVDRNQPEIRRRDYPGGWQQVQLEITALDYSVGYGALKFRQNDLVLVWRALYAVVRLRHLTCHWNPRDLGFGRPAPRTVDRHLKNVQKLAIHLYDEKHAAEARSLRDEARRIVEETVEEIESLEPLFDVYPWKYHHEQMFTQIEYAKKEHDPELSNYPEVVLRAAEAWSRRRASDQTHEEDWELGDGITEDIPPKTQDQESDVEDENVEDENVEDENVEDENVEDEKESAATITKHAFTTRILSHRRSISS